jgi:RNA polymerase sigma factor (sigma-70 family)
MPTDEELVKEIHQGSQAAMEVLVRRYYKVIFAYIYRKTTDYHISLDLTQETLIKMIKSLPIYKSQDKFSHWLISIAVNICRDYFRSRQYRDRQLIPFQNSTSCETIDNIGDLLSQKAERAQIQNALQELSVSQREAIILRYYHDLKVCEIAKVTSTNESAVKSRLFQGIAKLKRILGRMVDYEQKKC